jgi:hypothetical protein
MIKLTEDEILEMVLTERFAEMKFAEFSADWEDEKREIIYDMLKQDFEPMDVLGFQWGMFLEDQLKTVMENYNVEWKAYFAQHLKERD